MLNRLFEVIIDRKKNPVEGSYTNELFEAGYEQIAQKVGEEAVEVIISAGNQGRQRTIEEAADLIYHLLVLLANQEIDLKEVEKELERRHKR
ncbi:MAG: phosphoribosyl-ATP diphosphatase [Anaerolineales bacterium]|nr:phosphoribosyl-ATP diphosphatase [Anaerolineales bacterium]